MAPCLGKGSPAIERSGKIQLGSAQRVEDGLGVVAFEPAVGGELAFAGAVGAGVHHDDAVAGAEEKFGLGDDADAVVGDAVEEEDPVAVGMIGADDPAAERGRRRGRGR